MGRLRMEAGAADTEHQLWEKPAKGPRRPGHTRAAVLTGRTSPVVLVYCRASPKSSM